MISSIKFDYSLIVSVRSNSDTVYSRSHSQRGYLSQYVSDKVLHDKDIDIRKKSSKESRDIRNMSAVQGQDIQVKTERQRQERNTCA